MTPLTLLLPSCFRALEACLDQAWLRPPAVPPSQGLPSYRVPPPHRVVGPLRHAQPRLQPSEPRSIISCLLMTQSDSSCEDPSLGPSPGRAHTPYCQLYVRQGHGTQFQQGLLASVGHFWVIVNTAAACPVRLVVLRLLGWVWRAGMSRSQSTRRRWLRRRSRPGSKAAKEAPLSSPLLRLPLLLCFRPSPLLMPN